MTCYYIDREQLLTSNDDISILENDCLQFENEENNYYLNPIYEYKKERNINITNDEKRKLYYLEKKDSPIELFKTKKCLAKKRGREPRIQNQINENDVNSFIKIHDKNTSDNILRKIQVHYISFLVLFINEILYNLNFKQRFLNLNYSFKKNVKKEFVHSLKTKEIGEVLCNQISIKYKKNVNKKENINKNIYEQIKKNKILDNILSENYLLLFKKIYFKSSKLINLVEYGLNKNIILSDNVKMYKDLLKDNSLDINYKKNINKCVIKYFIPKLLFIID